MKLNLPLLAGAAAVAAATPTTGAEAQVQYSTQEWLHVGELLQTGALATEFSYTAKNSAIAAPGRDLHLRADNPIDGASASLMSVQLAVVFADNTTGNVTATFDIPSYWENRNNYFPRGFATDFLADDAVNAGKKIITINSVVAVNNGIGGNSFSIWASGEDDYQSVGCSRSKGAPIASSPTIPIACGFNGVAFTKRGRTEATEISISYVYVNSADGLMRVNDRRSTLKFEVKKDGRYHTESMIVLGFRGSGKPEYGDGDDEVVVTAEGLFENYFIFYAR